MHRHFIGFHFTHQKPILPFIQFGRDTKQRQQQPQIFAHCLPFIPIHRKNYSTKSKVWCRTQKWMWLRRTSKICHIWMHLLRNRCDFSRWFHFWRESLKKICAWAKWPFPKALNTLWISGICIASKVIGNLMRPNSIRKISSHKMQSHAIHTVMCHSALDLAIASVFVSFLFWCLYDFCDTTKCEMDLFLFFRF